MTPADDHIGLDALHFFPGNANGLCENCRGAEGSRSYDTGNDQGVSFFPPKLSLGASWDRVHDRRGLPGLPAGSTVVSQPPGACCDV